MNAPASLFDKPTAAPATPRDRLLAAVNQLAEAFTVLDSVAGTLTEPERGAVLMLKDDVGATMRRLSNVAAFLGAGAG